MKVRFECRARGMVALASATTFLAACHAAPDLSGVASESAKPVQRYDTTQALASNGKFVVAGTQSGALLVSGDQGRTWKRQPLAGASVIGIATCPDGRFVAVDFFRKVWSADPSGSGWKSVSLDKPRTPLAISCDGEGRWWVAGTGATLAVSADAGASWKVTDLQEDAQLTGIQMVDKEVGYATGEFGLVASTTDGGATWARQGKMPDEFYPYASLFASRTEGWVSGIAGQILHTTDGGKSWAKQTNASRAPLYRLFMHEGVPYGVGAGGVVARLEGNTWRNVAYPDAAPVFLAAAVSLPEQHAIVAGGPGGLLRLIGTQAQPLVASAAH
ncbi:YCF48-related protein [Zoogloea sp.]|uniref:YCF48-related protein n=1 Tax=Zoogloea sp. TaxID=49181 RepID=UPI0035AFFE06